MALAINNRNPNSAGLNKEDIVFLKKCRGGELISDLKDHQEPRISPFFPTLASQCIGLLSLCLLPVVTRWCPALGTMSSYQCPGRKRGVKSKNFSPLEVRCILETFPSIIDWNMIMSCISARCTQPVRWPWFAD